MHSSRGKGKSRPRILYWFRTPPGVRVGRSPLDADAVRLIEATYPDIEFDWREILKGRPEPISERPRAEPAVKVDRGARPADRRDRAGRGGRPPERTTAPRATPAPAGGHQAPQQVEPFADETGPAHVRLGTAGVARLRARFVDLGTRIRDRVEDDARREELKTAADRLNPDGWRTDEEVIAGLESYEATFEAVKTAIGGRRPAAQAAPAAVEGSDTGLTPDSATDGQKTNGPDETQ